MRAILKKIMLNTGWTKVDLGGYNDFYLIAEKCKGKSRSDTIDKIGVKKIKFEIGIDSFSNNKPLTINYITLNFDDISSSDIKTNEVTALVKVLNYPTVFYMRPIEIIMDDSSLIKEGKSSIKVGINPAKLN